MFIALRIILTALAFVVSRSINISLLPSYHGSVSGAFLLAALLEGAVWAFGRLTGKFFKAMGLDANSLDSESPPLGTALYFNGLLWLMAAAFLRVINHYSPDTISLAGWLSASVGGIIWLGISFVAAVLTAKVSPNVSAWWSTRGIVSPTHADSGVFGSGFIAYLRDTPYMWRKEVDGRIIGFLDRGFGWYYQVEWDSHNNTLVTSSGRKGLIATRAQVSIGFDPSITNGGLTESFEWLYRNARMLTALAELTEGYPGQPLFKLPEKYPAEIIVELERDAKMSRAIAVISQSDEHHHNVMVETYKILRGTLSVFLDGQERVLKEGEELVIQPGTKHWAKGDAAWVQVDCTPAWTPEDHILEPKK